MSWTSDRGVPDGAVQGGHDTCGTTLYVIRARHGNNLVPGKFSAIRCNAYVSYGGGEHLKHDFEVLVGSCFHWDGGSNGSVPANAFATHDGGEALYIGRVPHAGSITPGKIHPRRNACFISYGGKEHCYKEYDVLCKH